MDNEIVPDSSANEPEPTENFYLVQLAKSRKIRNVFELEKGKFFRTDTVAEILDIEPEVIRDFIRKKELYAIKIGKSYRIAEIDLQEFLNSRYTGKNKESNPNKKDE